jgi:hypothetical protein
MAVVLAVAVAAMPAAASAIAAAASTADASAAAMPADCPHHHAPADHGQKNTDNGAATAACAVKCFTYAGTVVPGIVLAPIAPQPRLLVSERRIASNIAAPPFRPPRI